MEQQVFEGMTGNLVINDAGVVIKRGAKGFLTQSSIRGDKHIPWESIVAVQYKEASFFGGSGYIQLTLRGGSEAKGGLLQAVKDENTVMWSNFPTSKKNEIFSKARDIIIARIVAPVQAQKTCPACAEEVKLAAKICRFCGYNF